MEILPSQFNTMKQAVCVEQIAHCVLVSIQQKLYWPELCNERGKSCLGDSSEKVSSFSPTIDRFCTAPNTILPHKTT